MSLTRFKAIVIAFFVIFASQPAHAEWRKAESDRFIIYSNSRADDLRDFAEMLERYHVAMTLETGRQIPVPSPSNRLTVYMVGSREKLREVYGIRNSAVGGFYIPRANGSVTFVPNVTIRNRGTNGRGFTRIRARSTSYEGRIISTLLHEYAHHFLISTTRAAMPRWLSEGAAEYFSSARFNDDGSVDIGLPNNERAYEISQAAEVPVIELLDYERYRDNRSGRYDNFYGRSWLLYHYLRFSEERRGQLIAYWQAVYSGVESIDAAKQIFGDLDTLEEELEDYATTRQMAGMRFSSKDIAIGDVTVSELSEGHADMMDVIIGSDRGVDDEKAAEVVKDARRIAAKYPNDAAVQEALAEAEYDAGFDDAAIAAADRAIAADPNAAKNAYVQKGYALFRKAGDADPSEQDAAYDAAMKPFEALNALEPDHTQPLIYYYRSYTLRGKTPPANARAALENATILAPFDDGLAMEVAQMKAAEGNLGIARYLLGPVAADPHGGSRGRLARAMVDSLANKEDGNPVSLSEVRRQFEEDNSEDEDDGDSNARRSNLARTIISI